MPALYLRDSFGCTNYWPYLNENKPQSNHLLTIEICLFICFAIQLLIAIRRKRVMTLFGILICGALFEFIGFINKSHVHNQYKVQVACFLPLKEVFWYGNTAFAGLIVAEMSGIKSKWTKALLASVLGSLQNFPYEMVSTKDGVDNYYVNEIDFESADFTDKINGASSAVVISVICIGLGINLVALTFRDAFNVVLIPLLAIPLMLLFRLPYHWIQYTGCMWFWGGEKTFLDFHLRCTKYSNTSDTAILCFVTVLAIIQVLSALKGTQMTTETMSKDVGSKMLIVSLALIAHGFIIYTMIEGARIPSVDLNDQVMMLLATASAHLGMLYLFMVPPSLDSDTSKKPKTKTT